MAVVAALPAARTAFLNYFLHTLMGVCGAGAVSRSGDRAGKIAELKEKSQNQPHSFPALGYFLSRARGRLTPSRSALDWSAS